MTIAGGLFRRRQAVLGSDTFKFSNGTTRYDASADSNFKLAASCLSIPASPGASIQMRTAAWATPHGVTIPHYALCCLLLLGALRRFDAHALGAGKRLEQCPLGAETTHCELLAPAQRRLARALSRRLSAVSQPWHSSQSVVVSCTCATAACTASGGERGYAKHALRDGASKWMANMLLTRVVIRAGSGA